ncbi:MAG: ribonuclease H-like domain-containing protein [Ignavibacteria bacterium]|nr:ribonuclease H-like domain-containing protein [Ignavibacteria bacterium]
MNRVVVDIETAHIDFEELSESQQEYLLREAEKIEDQDLKQLKIEESIRMMSLYPFTAKVVVLGMYSVEKQSAFVWYESEPEEEKWVSEGNTFKGLPEKELLQKFWDYTDKIDQLITFNGRGFDIPFLMLRSALLGIRPRKNFLGNRYDNSRHIDLLEQLSYYKTTKVFNLDFYCHAFGIESPKSKGVTGMEVQALYEAGRIKEVASYCARDIFATYQLYSKWEQLLKF